VTGRLLVGLRWWNDASASENESGTAWRFEGLAEGQREINPYERRWFWIVLVAAPILWALSAFSAFLGLDWGAWGGVLCGCAGCAGAGLGCVGVCAVRAGCAVLCVLGLDWGAWVCAECVLCAGRLLLVRGPSAALD